MHKKSILFALVLCMNFQNIHASTVTAITSKFHQVTHVFTRLKQILSNHKYLIAASIAGTALYKKKAAIGRFCTRIFNRVKARFFRPIEPAQPQAPIVVPVEPAQQPAPVGGLFLPIEQYPQNALFDAIERDDRDLVQYLLPHKDRFSQVNDQHNSLLARAIELGNLAIVRILLNDGYRYENGNARMPSALHVAARYGHRAIARELLDHPRRRDINYSVTRGLTALHVAAEHGHEGVVIELIINGANIDQHNMVQQTPLYLAARNGHSEVVWLLAMRGANLDPVIDQATGLPYPGEGALHTAAINRHFDTVRTLIQGGANINAVNDRGQLFDQIIDDPQIRTFRPFTDQLFDAIRRGNEEDASIAFNAGASPFAFNQAGSTPIHEAIDVYRPEATERDRIAHNLITLVGQRSTRVRDVQGRTPLHRAVMYNNLRLALMLLRAHADVNAQDNGGNTPLHYAGNHLMRNLLMLRYGANAAIVNNAGLTPIRGNLAAWQYGL